MNMTSQRRIRRTKFGWQSVILFVAIQVVRQSLPIVGWLLHRSSHHHHHPRRAVVPNAAQPHRTAPPQWQPTTTNATATTCTMDSSGPTRVVQSLSTVPTTSTSTAITTTTRPPRSSIRRLFSQAKLLEKKGQWRKASRILRDILAMDPQDAHSHLALARLEARRHAAPLSSSTSSSSSSSISSNNNSFSNHSPRDAYERTITEASSQQQQQQQQFSIVRETFQNGTVACPDSVHLWQAWAVYEESIGQADRARALFQRALALDPYNPYVCHAYGLLEKKSQNLTAAMTLWNQALTKHSTAALVCSLGEALLSRQDVAAARELYRRHAQRVTTSRESIEIYLAHSWLEERYQSDFDQAQELIQKAISCSVNDRGTVTTSSLAQVALARLEGRRRQAQQGEQMRKATIRRLASACIGNEEAAAAAAATAAQGSLTKTTQTTAMVNSKKSEPVAFRQKHSDGRVYNAWASMEVRARRFSAARKILLRGLRLYPRDHSLLQAAGKVEERMGNYTAARDYYSASLRIQPSAPTLVSYALLDLKYPQSQDQDHKQSGEGGRAAPNISKIIRLFEEALLLDPRHGPAYNAYARTLIGQNNIDAARAVLERGLRAKCSDMASIYHGYARLELSLGNIHRARDLLIQGQQEAHRQDIGKDSPHRERAVFLTHTLGMLELNRNRPTDSIKVFQEGIDRYGNSSQLLLGAALCQIKLGNEEKARELFELSVLNDERHAHAWQAWGVMEMRAGNVKTAIELFECGIKSAPYHGALWQAYATLESRLGHVDTARALFTKGIKRAPKHIPLYQSWASMELREGNYTASKALITEALTRNKRNGAGWLIAAEIEDRLGNAGLSILLLRRGIECSPTTPELYRSLGDALVRKGKFNEAREIFEKGIEVDPMHAPLYHNLAELEARVFNVEGLAKLHKRASKFFNANVNEPSNSSSEVYGTKLRANRTRHIPKGVALLAQRIVEEEPVSTSDLDLTVDSDQTSFLDKMNSNLLEDGLIKQLLSFEDQEEVSESKSSSSLE